MNTTNTSYLKCKYPYRKGSVNFLHLFLTMGKWKPAKHEGESRRANHSWRVMLENLGCVLYSEIIIIYVDNILGDPGAASRDHGIFMGESLQQERESPWALTLTERVPEAFEIPPSDWPEKIFSGQLAKRNSRTTQMSSYMRLFSSSIAVVAWPVQREHFLGELQKKKINTK